MRVYVYVSLIMVIVLMCRFISQQKYPLRPVLHGLHGKRVLVTGGAGFIGHHVIIELLSRDVPVVGIDNFNDYYNTSLKYARSEISNVVQNVDVCDSHTINGLFDEYDFTHVIHLAAQAGVRYSIENPALYEKINIGGFIHILEESQKNNVKQIPIIKPK